MVVFIPFLFDSTPKFQDWLHASPEADNTQACRDSVRRQLWAMLRTWQSELDRLPQTIFHGLVGHLDGSDGA